MNGRPGGPSLALLEAQRRLEDARRSYQRSAGSCQWSLVSDQRAVASVQCRAPDLPSPISASESPIPDPQITLHPSLALAMLGKGMAAPGRIWLLLRHLDGAGQGWLDLDQVQEQLCHKESALHVCGRRQLRNLLRRGQGIFWQRDKTRIWLRSAARAAIALETDRLRGRPVALPLQALLGGIGQVRAHFYATFHSSRAFQGGRTGAEQDGPGNPISRKTLRKVTRVPARTQRLYEQRASVQAQSNIAIGERLTDKDLQERAWRHGRATFLYTDSEGKHGPAGGRYVAWRLPNSYSGPHALSPKGRMKKINHQIDLVNSRVQGNDLDRTAACKQVAVRFAVDRLFHPDGQSAGRSYNRDRSKDTYWPANRRRRGQQLWRVLPGKSR